MNTKNKLTLAGLTVAALLGTQMKAQASLFTMSEAQSVNPIEIAQNSDNNSPSTKDDQKVKANKDQDGKKDKKGTDGGCGEGSCGSSTGSKK
jgi:hypothetical protein